MGLAHRPVLSRLVGETSAKGLKTGKDFDSPRIYSLETGPP